MGVWQSNRVLQWRVTCKSVLSALISRGRLLEVLVQTYQDLKEVSMVFNAGWATAKYS